MFTYVPFSYDELNFAEGTYTPSEVKNIDNYTYWYWVRSLLQRLTSVLEFNFPDNLSAESKDFIIYCLFMRGYVVCFNDKKFGFSMMNCTLNGFDFYYQPTEALVTNPALSKTFTIHKDCELIKLTPDYHGVWDVVNYYAEKLANMSCAFDMTVENSKVAYVLSGKTKSARESLKKIVDKISKGISTIIFDSRVMDTSKDIEPFSWLTRNAKDSYIGNDMLQDIQTVLNMFDREIGIPTIPYQKKERMIEYESKSALIDASSRITTWMNCLNESINNVNAMFGTDISVEQRIDVQELAAAPEGVGGEENE